jgi:hypothetical protein
MNKKSISKLSAFQIGINNGIVNDYNIKSIIDKIQKLESPEHGYVFLDDVNDMYENELKNLIDDKK